MSLYSVSWFKFSNLSVTINTLFAILYIKITKAEVTKRNDNLFLVIMCFLKKEWKFWKHFKLFTLLNKNKYMYHMIHILSGVINQIIVHKRRLSDNQTEILVKQNK